METTNEFFSKYLEQLSIKELSQIQKLCMEPLLKGESLCGLSPTGSGKTLAFILPLLLKTNHNLREPQILILVPTRELGNQVASVANKVAQAISSIDNKNILVRTIFGGTPIASQVEEVSKGPQVLVATPGRTIDLLERDVLKLSSLKSLILDEADIMVGMGFSDQVEAICDYLPKNLQVGLFSATQNEKVSVLEKILLKDNKYLSAKVDENNESNNEDSNSPNIYHSYLLTERDNKYKLLVKLLSEFILNKTEKGIIFCHTRETSHQLAESLKNEGFSVEALSGELGQVHRNSVMRNFKTGSLKFLVATNIAARGIDIAKLPLVIHFDIPYTNEEYVHRSGRTGRAGNSGISIALCEEKNLGYYLNMMKELGISTKKQIVMDKVKQSDYEKNSNIKNNKITFVKLFINKGKQDKIRPGDILGAFIQELSLTKEDLGNIYIFDNFTHVEVNENKINIVKRKKFKIKNLQVKISDAK